MTMKIRRATALLLTLLLAGACSDSTGSDSPRPGTVLGIFSGHVGGPFTGTARLLEGYHAPGSVTIQLSDSRIPRETRVLHLIAPSHPVPGVYSLGPMHSGLYRGEFYLLDEVTGGIRVVLTTMKGTVTIEEASVDGVRGRYEIAAADDDPITGQRYTLSATGHFHAIPQPVG
jgi:hypothetical protein